MEELLLTCPSCETTLVVDANASPLVMCPNCLSRIANPHAPTDAPQPVLPLDLEATQDMGQISVGLVVVACMLLGSIAIPYIGLEGVYLWLALVLVSGALSFVIYRDREASNQLEDFTSRSLPDQSIDDGSSVLNYAGPEKQQASKIWPAARAIGVMFLTGSLIALGAFLHVLYLCGSF